jgi:hypothetical protein
MISSLEIVEKIREYLGAKISLDSFRAYIVRAHRELAEVQRPSPLEQDAARLISEIEGRYAEFSDDVVSENLWRRQLAYLIVPAPKSAESFFLTYFYSMPSVFISNPGMVMVQPQTGNINSVRNYQAVPELEKAAA